jgi:hypothetical protein
MQVGEILQDILGKQLFSPQGASKLPSPNELKGMFIVKGKVPAVLGGEELDEGNEQDLKVGCMGSELFIDIMYVFNYSFTYLYIG